MGSLVGHDGDTLLVGLFPDLEHVQDLRATAPCVERRFAFRVPCPRWCQARRALWGMPSTAMDIPLALGEVIAMGCLLK